MVALRRSLFVTDKTDDAMSLDEVKLKAAFQREMANAAELDSLLANELDSNAFCQLACLRATRNLCRLIQQVTT